ncbi:MAG: molecular chaperone HtpG [Ruminococcaceae bacterium]|nr:molecular chaperone HtpG [Oscillospiraceae bacterium]
MAKKQFKAESKRLLDLMINSIYTHKEIFLRELISNSSDALDKLYFRSLTDQSVTLSKEDMYIRIAANKDERTLTISDNGCGMSKEELESNLGTIAKSGSFAFKNENGGNSAVDIIGQFGVGFYSAFMVSKTVEVKSKAYGSDEAYLWKSDGADGYTITPCEMKEAGTQITLTIKENTEDESYDEYLESYRLQGIIKKYSDYIRYPIKMYIETQRPKEDNKEEFETVVEDTVLNSMVPIWKKSADEVDEESYNNFYREKFFDFEKPVKVIHSKTEGTATYNALLFIPSKAPYDYYTKNFEKGLMLFSGGVLIMEKCADLLPDCFSFVRGLVDSEDLSLNISREMLQHDRQLKIIAKSLEKKIKTELKKLLANDREKYEEFYKSFGLNLKFGIYNSFGMNKDLLQDLILFHSSSENKMSTLEEYASRMKEEQKYIYYATGESVAKIDLLPQIELIKDKGFEVLYLTDDIDEFAVKVLHEYDGKEFKSVSSDNLDLDTEEEKEAQKKLSENNADMLKEMKEALGEKVSKVAVSNKLKTHPVCLTAEGELSLEMEKVLNAMPNATEGMGAKANRVLELNANHPVFEALIKLYTSDKEKLKTYAELLYNQALLIEGLPIDNPLEFSNKICELML